MFWEVSYSSAASYFVAVCDDLQHESGYSWHGGSLYSAADWYFLSVCHGWQHESGYSGHELEIMAFRCSSVFCSCLQWTSAWISFFRKYAGDHGIQLQLGILLLFAMYGSMNQLIQDTRWKSWYSAATWYFFTCSRWLAAIFRLFMTWAGVQGIKLQLGILYLVA